MKKHKLKLKFWGNLEAVKCFRKFIDDNFICVISDPIESDQGGFHAYATLEVGAE